MPSEILCVYVRQPAYIHACTFYRLGFSIPWILWPWLCPMPLDLLCQSNCSNHSHFLKYLPSFPPESLVLLGTNPATLKAGWTGFLLPFLLVTQAQTNNAQPRGMEKQQSWWVPSSPLSHFDSLTPRINHLKVERQFKAPWRTLKNTQITYPETL